MLLIRAFNLINNYYVPGVKGSAFVVYGYTHDQNDTTYLNIVLGHGVDLFMKALTTQPYFTGNLSMTIKGEI